MNKSHIISANAITLILAAFLPICFSVLYISNTYDKWINPTMDYGVPLFADWLILSIALIATAGLATLAIRHKDIHLWSTLCRNAAICGWFTIGIVYFADLVWITLQTIDTSA